jgi:hypothetical protein
MSEITTLVSPGHLVRGEIRVSEIQAGQPKLGAGRWNASNQYCAIDARPTAVDFDLPKHAALMTGAPTDVPTTGVPPSAVKRRT